MRRVIGLTGYAREVDQFKAMLLRDTIERYGGNRTRTARDLGLNRTYIARLVRDLNLDVPAPRRPRDRRPPGTSPASKLLEMCGASS